MGNTCAPDHHAADVNVDMEPSERITAIINKYQAENERMGLELDSLKTKSEETCQAYADRTKQNWELMQELALIKTSMCSKDRSIVRHLLEAALYSSASSILSEESISKKVMEGYLQKFGRAGKVKSKRKYVEIYLICGEGKRTQFTKGHLMLIWADCQESKISSRGTVIEVKEETTNVNSKLQERSFSILAKVKGAVKALVFTCDDKESKELWVQSCRSGLAQIVEEEKYMTELFSLQIEFSKEKLGFRVEETLLKKKEIVDKNNKEKSEDKVVGIPDLSSGAVKPEDECEEAAKVVQMIEGETEETEEQAKSCGEIEEKHETVDTAGEKDFTKTDKSGCELLITQISDQELLSKGLLEYLTVRKINNLILAGKRFTEQVKILTTTKKPFTLTFTGPNYLKKQLVSTTAYASILKDLVDEGENDVKSTFYTMVKGSAVEDELKAGEKGGVAPIKALLSNRGRLITLLQNLKDYEEEIV